jgi:CheY-like chemotaxis protein
MASLKIPTAYDPSRILLADDEPEHLDWLVDYLAAKGFKTTIVTNIKESVGAFEACAYRAYIVDLNIPFGGWVPSIPEPSGTYSEYHGLYALKLIRSQGVPGDRVIAYSAHYNEQIVSEIKRLYCKYVVKNRPPVLKAEIDPILKRDPGGLTRKTPRKKGTAALPPRVSKSKSKSRIKRARK